MNNSKTPSALTIGMALFAMFFGSGNLIYPLYLGTIAQESWMSATVGFLSGAVVFPFLGILAMVLYQGCYSTFFSCLGKKGEFILTTLLLTVWIPLGSAPRCISVAYASLAAYTWAPPLWIFSLLLSGLVFLVVYSKQGILDILGRFITPVLLACIAAIAFVGIFFNDTAFQSTVPSQPMFGSALLEGFNTMDLIASFFFSASVIHMLNRSERPLTQTVSLVFRSGIIGMVILGIVYAFLIYVSASHADLLVGVPKEQMLAVLAQHLMGQTYAAVAIIAIILACFSTFVALVIAYADFLKEEIFKSPEECPRPTLLALLASFVMSLFGLKGISFVTEPVLQICYPILLILIIWNISKKVMEKRSQLQSVESA